MKLSIAIPAYNAEKTLERTVRSILAQTFTDFEILIVNNGSRDATGDIARKLAETDSRIQVFDVYPNIWGYGARLYAWKRAKGEYIATVDADDFIDPNMYKSMLDLADQHNLDVVECDFVEDPGTPQSVNSPIRQSVNSPICQSVNPTITQSLPPPTFALTQGLVFRTYVYPTLIDVGKSAYTWNKIYRNQYDFSTWVDGVFGSYEDLIHNLQLFRPVKRYAHLPMPFYHYAPNPSSVTRNYSADRIEQFVTTVKMKRKLVGHYGIEPDAPVMRRWIRNDAKNGIISALTAGRLPWRQRIRLAWQMFCKVGDLDPDGAWVFQVFRRYREFVVYCLIGGSGVVVDFTAFWLLNTGCLLHYQVANFLSFSVANLSNFLLNAHFNFKVKDRLWVRFMSFYGVGLFSWFLGAGFLYALFEKCGIPVLISKAIALVAVTAVQFTLNKLVTFRKRKQS